MWRLRYMGVRCLARTGDKATRKRTLLAGLGGQVLEGEEEDASEAEREEMLAGGGKEG